MAGIEISLKKSTANPTSASGLTLAEPVFNSSNNTFWIGKGGSNTPAWVGAGICGASGGIAAGLTYQIPTLGAIKDYFAAVSTTFVGTTSPYISTFNGLTGAVQGVSAAVAGTGISVSGATGSVTITNIGVQSFNGLTGSVGGVCAAQANTFTALQTFSAGISAAGGITFNGGTVWTSANDGATSGLDAGALYGISAGLYASSLSTGLLYGGLVTINAGNSAAFDITAGAGYIVSTGATYTSEPSPVITRVSWTAKTGVTLSGLTAQDTTWIYFDSSGNLQQQSSYYTDDQIQSTIAIGALVHPTRSYISLARSIPNVSYATDKQYEQFIRAFGPMKVSGHTIQASGTDNSLNRTSGTAFILGRNYSSDPNNPSVVSDAAKTDADIWRYYRGATAGSFVTVTGFTGIDPTRFDNGSGTLATVSPSTPFTIQRVFFFPNTPNVLGVYYGRAQYASLADAANNIHLEDFTEITNTATNAVFVASVLVKYNVTNLSTSITAGDARIIQAGQFRSTTSGGGTVATKLDDLTDVSLTSIADDDLIIYDVTTSQWLNTPLEHIGVTRVNGATGSVSVVSSFNGLTGAVTGVTVGGTNTFTALNTFNAGISAAGGITFNGTLTGVTATFTRLLSANAGISSAGGTFTSRVSFSAGLSAAGITTDTITSIKEIYGYDFGVTSGITLYADSESANKVWTSLRKDGTNATGLFDIRAGTVQIKSGGAASFGSNPSLKLHISDGDVSYYWATIGGDNSVISADREYYLPDGSGTLLLDSTVSSVAVTSFNGNVGAVQGVSAAVAGTGISVSGATGVQSFNGRTGAVQGVSAAVAGTGISVSGATGAVTITNIGVQSFNGLTGAVTGVTVGGTNTFTALNSFNAGISSAGGTFSSLTRFTAGITASTLFVSGGVTLNSNLYVGANTTTGFVQTSGVLPFNGSGLGGLLHINALDDGSGGGGAVTRIGDYAADNNNTYIEVDDSTGTITLNANNGFNASNVIATDTVSAPIFQDNYSYRTTHLTTTTTTTANQTIAEIPNVYDDTTIPAVMGYPAFEVTISARDNVLNKTEMLKMLVVQDGTNTVNTQYGLIRTGATGPVSAYSTTLSGSPKSLLIRATPLSANSTKFTTTVRAHHG
jgi:hypothetical protein